MNRLLRQFLFSAIVLCLALSSAGCATIFSGSSQEVQIRSSPSIANVKIERTVSGGGLVSVWSGSTPAVVNLKRKYPYLVSISQEGYKTSELGIQKTTNGWVFGNLIFFPLGTLVGAGIDYGTGAAHSLKPNELFVELEKDSSSVSSDRTGVVLGAGRDVTLQAAQESPSQVARPAPPAIQPVPGSSAPQPSRKGFLIGFGIGPGLTSYTYGFEQSGGKFVSDRVTKSSFVTDFKIGYAPDDLLQLYWMSKVSWFGDSDVFLLHGVGGLGASYALKATAPSPYISAGIGFSSWQAPLEENFEALTGLGLSAGAGFEFSKHWLFNLDLTWGRPSRDNMSTNATAVRFTVSYLHY